MNNPSRISMILVQYNNSSDVVKCLESLKHSDSPNLNIVVVDNASNQIEVDVTRNYLKNQWTIGNWKLIIENSNLGYSEGNNVGIKYAFEHGADYILVINPDVTLGKDSLEKMIKVGESNQQIGAVGPVIDEGDRKIAGGKIYWLKPELSHIGLDEKSVLPTAVKNTHFFLTGACLLIKREVLEKIGMFDERYFLYFEDADLCVQIQKAGYRLAIAKDALVHHKVSSTTSKLGAARLLRYHYRNAHIFNMKNAPLWAFVLLPFWSILVIIKQLLKLAIGREKLISREILLGVLDFYRGNFGMIQ